MKAIVFDMDGTLLDSMAEWRSLEKRFIQQLNIPEDQVDFEQMNTMGTSEVTEYLKKLFKVEITGDDLVQFAMDEMRKYYTHRVRLKPGALKVLDFFKDQGIPLAIGTATHKDLALVALENAGLLSYFEFVYSSSVDHYAKNDKRFFRACSQAFQEKPEDMILFDDALYALVAAKEAGYYTIAMVDQAYEQDLDILKRRSDLLVENFDSWDMENWFKAFKR